MKPINPLTAFFRQPKIYFELPSKGNFYPPGALEMTETGELPVFAMTAKDELMFKTPDALLNGSSTVEVIKSCVPNIKDPWAMPSIDVDAVLCAIRLATYGHELELSSRCPNCNHTNDRMIDIRVLLDNLKNIQFQTDVIIDDNIVVHLRPLNYSQITKTSLKAFEHQRIFSIVNDASIEDEEKVRLFQESFIKLTELTIEAVTQSIASIDTSAGSTNNPDFIREFLRNTDKKIFEEINKAIENSKEQSKIPALDTKCDECEFEYKIALTLDQADFFGKGF